MTVAKIMIIFKPSPIQRHIFRVQRLKFPHSPVKLLVHRRRIDVIWHAHLCFLFRRASRSVSSTASGQQHDNDRCHHYKYHCFSFHHGGGVLCCRLITVEQSKWLYLTHMDCSKKMLMLHQLVRVACSIFHNDV